MTETPRTDEQPGTCPAATNLNPGAHRVALFEFDTINGRTYQAKCSCGWAGQVYREQLRDNADDAAAEGRSHMTSPAMSSAVEVESRG